MNVIWKVRLEITSLLTFHIHCRIWVRFGVRDLHTISLSSCEFLEVEAGNVYVITFYPCTAKLYNILKTKSALLKYVYCVTEYTFFQLVILCRQND